MQTPSKSWLSRLKGQPLRESKTYISRPSSLNARSLAEQYGVCESTMENFLNRFSPKRVDKDAYKSNNDTMLFIHIPKTAGVSLGKTLQQAFDVFHGVQWNDIPRSFREATRCATYASTRSQTRQAIMGHFGWPELQLWRNHELPLKCGTIFRDPTSRIISNYNYNRSAAHPDNAKFKATFPTLHSYAQQVPFDPQLTQAIGFTDSFENALRKLVKFYTFLGATECLPKSLKHFGRSHGLPNLPEFRENIGKPSADAGPSSDLSGLIESRSYNDLKIHRLMLQIYGDEDANA